MKPLAMFFAVLSLAAPLGAVPVFIGTSTGEKSASKGIYRADFDPAAGTLTQPVLVAEYKNPGFLALHPAKPVLYACGRPGAPFADGTDSVAAFAIGDDGPLKFLGEASTGGHGVCHLAVDATGRTVALANYGDGVISTVALDEAGVPRATVSVVSNSGAGHHKTRQQGPHAHGVYFGKDNARLYAPDLGLDTVFIYPFDAATSKLGEPLPPLRTAPGAGPRHLAFSPDWKNAYVANELANTVLAADFAENGGLVPSTDLSTLPADFTGPSTAAEIEVHPNGLFVYASNRGHDSIVVYRRDAATGKLTLLQHAPCGGKVPRHFKIDPTGKWLVCAHANTISMLALDPATGLLGEPSGTVATPSPICVLFGR